MTGSQGFVRRVKDRVAPEEKVVTHFFLETTDIDDNGDEFVVRHDDFTASMPSQEQLLAAMAEGGRESATIADETAAMFDLLRAALPQGQYRLLLRRFKDPNDPDVDFETIQDLFAYLMEQWQDFPTQSPAASSGSSGTSGGRSTGRARGKGSIPST